MKRVICVLSVILLLASACACAENEFSGLSFTELLQKQNDLNTALWASDGWQEVTVPAGMYIIGQDIPAGTWVVRTAGSYSTVWWGHSDENGTFPEFFDFGQVLTKPGFPTGEEEFVLRVTDGQIIQIEDSPVTFSTYVPSFTFK